MIATKMPPSDSVIGRTAARMRTPFMTRRNTRSITRSVRVPRRELELSFSTSGGAGGQHANRNATRVDLRFDVTTSSAFTEGQRDRVVRALVYYPLNVGRNVDEIVRLLDGLQTADKNACATPVNWQPGEKVVVPPPKTAAEVAERNSHDDYERFDFYLNKKSL